MSLSRKNARTVEKFQYQVWEDHHTIIGVVGLRRPSHLFHLHVARDFHGKGLGRTLWEAA
ncbi:MAG: GNAT family N-acetyltransferase [Proteobacteria bacterium]|nr:MAG: GNAT family N-acetyltransferase [Pseudomonadota bacterium]